MNWFSLFEVAWSSNRRFQPQLFAVKLSIFSIVARLGPNHCYAGKGLVYVLRSNPDKEADFNEPLMCMNTSKNF